MEVKDFYYELPQELIAQDPLEDRSSSRLLVMQRESGALTHTHFCQIPDYLQSGDCLVLNNTKVIPARLFGEREGTQGKVEILLLRQRQKDVWETLVKPGKKAKPGTRILFGGGILVGEVLDVVEQMPLPPYITHQLKDKNRYQTVYAKYDGSAAAPTAGLHFTPELLEEVQKKGVTVAEVTLHVGLGTFRPVKAKTVQEHHMHAEYYQMDEAAAEAINETKRRGGRVICVGTTSCRTLESVAMRLIQEEGDEAAGSGRYVKACSGWTDIFIYPGYQFRVMDGLITNFHLPESTLLMLVSAFAGQGQVMEAYQEAVRERYRFFSFGDAMLIC